MSEYREKNVYRELFKSRRDSMSDFVYRSSSRSICRNLSTLALISSATTIHAFWPVLARREPDIRSFLIELAGNDFRVVLPIVTAFTKELSERPRLRHVEFSGVDQLRLNRWGIYEPVNGNDVGTDEIDLIVAPALVVDMRGYRLGHGYGYYDEFLSGLKIPVICPIFADWVVDALPHDENDVPVSLIVTEKEIIDLTKT